MMTNQFNLTTKRYGPQEIVALVESTNHTVYSVLVKDKFGEYDVVILAIVNYTNQTAIMDTFLMSCRVIGKQIKNGFMNWIHKDLQYDLHWKRRNFNPRIPIIIH